VNNMFSKSAIWVVVALLLFMLFKQFDNHSVAGGSKTIAYSELLDDVKAKRIKDVVIEGSSITATRTDDTKVRTTATMLDRGLIGDLRDNNVRFDVKPPEEPSFLQQVFISWFPMLLLIGVWVFFMRQMQGGGKGGAFSRLRSPSEQHVFQGRHLGGHCLGPFHRLQAVRRTQHRRRSIVGGVFRFPRRG
jgi:cell division protease FtsH